jgi:CBS domain-containing protein
LIWLSDPQSPPRDPNVVYSRGKGCGELAELLSPTATRVGGDLDTACIAARADVLVTRKPPASFSLIHVASPIDFDRDEVTTVVAAVAGGPHSEFNVQLCNHLSRRLQVEMIIASAVYGETPASVTEEIIARLGEWAPEAKQLSVPASAPGDFVGSLPEGSLLVMGESGGSLLSRVLFGPGARLRASAKAGAVIVRAAPARVFQMMDEPVFVGPLHLAGDGLRLHDDQRLAVVDGGKLVGLVSQERLRTAAPNATVDSLMDEPRSLNPGMSLVEAASSLGQDGPWPVVDDDGHMIGTYHLTGASPR